MSSDRLRGSTLSTASAAEFIVFADQRPVHRAAEQRVNASVTALALPGPYKLPCCLVLTVQARSDEGSSPETRLLIEWDGRWDRGDKEVLAHLTFEILDDHPSTG